MKIMITPRLENIHVSLERQNRFVASRLWREWCFARVIFAHFRIRLLLMLGILLAGGYVFYYFEPEKQLTYIESVFYSWSLVFGEPPEAFPKSHIVQLMFFLMPILGLTVIIEGIIDFSIMLRDRKRYEQGWCKIMSKALTNHIVIIGFGRLGYQTFRLLRRLGEPVVIIEQHADNEFLEDVRRDGSPLFIGDARRESLLHDVNITQAKSIVLATDDDLANLEIALDARKIAPNIRVVLRMFDQHMADKVSEGFNIHLALSQSTISAPSFAMSAIDSSIIHSFVVGKVLIAVVRWCVTEHGPLCQKTVGSIMSEHGLGIIEINSRSRKNTLLFPVPDIIMHEGDLVVLQGPYETIINMKHDVECRLKATV